ncbi:hypothetical protein B9Z55_015656 [Caenorhabditis nigoni]|uniref:Uncharacterized protein n=1 Tax=Caenorhabditis nigoni TaxID=1611254 RepID=A0A2G5UB60_9PELO|nr:hypothetical protein B9Z55_015656 [Caenorhabditis nigoni]
MIKVFGSIKTDNYIPYVPEEDETCDQHCFDSDYCVLTVNNTVECLELSHVDRNNTYLIERGSSGSKVSFKVTLPDNNCPAFNEINYSLTLPSGEILYWNETESGWEWKQCREGWKKFERSDGNTVCMQTFRVDEGITRNASKTECEEIGAKLTGVASVDESEWIHGKLMESEKVTDWYSFWIDGQRQCDSLGNCVTLPDNNCPAFDTIDWTLTLPSGDIKSWNPTELGWEWKECRDGWKKFERDYGRTVCMQTFRVDEGIKRNDSLTKCNEIGTNLTGLVSEEETNWIYEQLREIGEENSYDSYAYWIVEQMLCPNSCYLTNRDGYSLSSYALEHHDYLKEELEKENCMFVYWTPEPTVERIYVTSCETAQGYVCGYRLK